MAPATLFGKRMPLPESSLCRCVRYGVVATVTDVARERSDRRMLKQVHYGEVQVQIGCELTMELDKHQ